VLVLYALTVGGTAIPTNLVAVITGFAGILDPISAADELDMDTATV